MKDSRRNLFTLRAFLREYFDLQKERESQSEVIEDIRNGIEYKGSRLWILLLSILIASFGMNMNVVYVVIGAMLISPMLGPIMGIGLALGMNDFDLMKRSLQSYLMTTFFSVVTATVYFLISPTTVIKSEFMFQTSPTIYNVLIAFSGGFAGFIAMSSTKKGTVLSGVAIVTALIPPLCTAGFGLSTGNLVYFLGALYLYFIDTIFIGFATFLGVRMFRYPKMEFVNKKREWEVRKYMFLIVIISMIPTLYFTSDVIRTAIFTARANRFVTEQFNFKGSSVLYNKYSYNPNGDPVIQVLLVGKEISQASIDQLRMKMHDYKLDKTELDVMQGMNRNEVNAVVHGDMSGSFHKDGPPVPAMKKSEVSMDLNTFVPNKDLSSEIRPEARVLFNHLTTMSVGTMLQANDTQHPDTIIMVIAQFDQKPDDAEREKLSTWLQTRLHVSKNFSLIVK
jgi:uncharacterized hydrophobic protein (TIGR00271 family)